VIAEPSAGDGVADEGRLAVIGGPPLWGLQGEEGGPLRPVAEVAGGLGVQVAYWAHRGVEFGDNCEGATLNILPGLACASGPGEPPKRVDCSAASLTCPTRTGSEPNVSAVQKNDGHGLRDLFAVRTTLFHISSSAADSR
jgi:hypothetical protein